MGILLWVLLITSIAGIGGTGLGGIISSFIKKDSNKTVSLLLSFAAGVMLSVVCFDLIESALFPDRNTTESTLCTTETTLWLTVIGIMVGFLLVAALNYLIDRSTNQELKHIDESHPKTADDLDELIHSDHYKEHQEEKSNLFIAGVIMALAIALHNLPEGMVIGASYVHTDIGDIWSKNQLLIAIVIGLHNIPEGMSVAVPLMAGGMKKGKAILVTALSGAPTVIGALIGYLLGAMGDFWHIISLSFASGAMLYVVFGELLPESILMWRSKMPAFALLVGMILGMIIIFI